MLLSSGIVAKVRNKVKYAIWWLAGRQEEEWIDILIDDRRRHEKQRRCDKMH